MTESEMPVHTQDGTARRRPSRPRGESIRLGKEIYEHDIRPQVEAAHHGEIISIDVETGNWAVGDSVIAATDRLRAQYPDTVDTYSLRIGDGVLRHFGGRPLGISWR